MESPDIPSLAERISAEIDPLYRFALSLSGDPSRAADLVQDTVVRAIERQDQYHGGSLRAWLKRILHNLAVDRARRASHEMVVERVEDLWRSDDYTVDTADVVARIADLEDLRDALESLPFIYRAAVVLHDAEGHTVAEIADITGVSLPAAKQRLRRGRMMLVSALDEKSTARSRALHKGVPMRCWDARQHISEYLDGALDESTARAVEAHLAHCPTCPPLYAALVSVQNRMDDLRDPDSVVPPDLSDKIEAHLSGAG